jgi:hypothetical protein
MPTPKAGYYIDGQRIPGTTTIIGRFKDSGALMYWAWQQGKEGKDFRETAEAAASAGTLAHLMVEDYLKDTITPTDPLISDDIRAKADSAFNAFLAWERQSNLKVISLEQPYVSHQHRYGGTPDGIVEVDGQLAILDIKTSSDVYRDHLIQVAAYRGLYEEVTGKQVTGGFHILRFAKENGDFSHHYYSELNDAWHMFLHLRAAYSLDLKLKKRAR